MQRVPRLVEKQELLAWSPCVQQSMRDHLAPSIHYMPNADTVIPQILYQDMVLQRGSKRRRVALSVGATCTGLCWLTAHKDAFLLLDADYVP